MMEKNIFKGAYFGKAYKTRDGRKAILVSLSDFAELTMELDNPPYITSINITCGLDGKIINKYLSSNQDIVSEWHEEELDKLVEIEFPYFPDKTNLDKAYNKIINDLRIAFKEGYCKAKEE